MSEKGDFENSVSVVLRNVTTEIEKSTSNGSSRYLRRREECSSKDVLAHLNLPSGINNQQFLEATDSVSNEDEKEHFQKIMRAFLNYKTYCLQRVCKAEQTYQHLPPHHQCLLPNFKEHLQQVFAAIQCNGKLTQKIVDSTGLMFENRKMPAMQDLENGQIKDEVDPFHMDKVISTLKQFARDWSAEGRRERDECYKPILDAVCGLYPNESRRSDIEVLVPGAGLGRLAFEFANEGFTSQGNEFSYFMLAASYFILNRVNTSSSYLIYPYVMQFSNNLHTDDQLQHITIPDVNPAQVNRQGSFTMVAGDFLDAYTQPETWDVIACSFFLDTAHNVISYLERMFAILKPGGYLINIGPLLYHYSDMEGEFSLEISYEQIRHVMSEIGFEMIREDLHVPCHYTHNTKSMMSYQYDCVFFVVQKPYTYPDEVGVGGSDATCNVDDVS